MKNFFKSAVFKTLVVVALFLLGIIIYSIASGSGSIQTTITGAIVTPIQSIGASISDAFYNFIGIFTDAGELRKENEALTEEINELRKSQVELDEMRRLNDTYEDFLEIKRQNPNFKFAHGRVIASDTTEKYKNFTINAGSISEVKVNDPVISSDGLVGVVYEVHLSHAKVRTIFDPDVQVSSYISRNNASGVTGGSTAPVSDAQIRMNYISRDQGPSITAGDYVVSSGLGGIFPPGLLIGRVDSIQPESHGTAMYAAVTPFADIGSLSAVFVITDFTGQGGE